MNIYKNYHRNHNDKENIVVDPLEVRIKNLEELVKKQQTSIDNLMLRLKRSLVSIERKFRWRS